MFLPSRAGPFVRLGLCTSVSPRSKSSTWTKIVKDVINPIILEQYSNVAVDGSRAKTFLDATRGFSSGFEEHSTCITFEPATLRFNVRPDQPDQKTDCRPTKDLPSHSDHLRDIHKVGTCSKRTAIFLGFKGSPNA